MKKFFLVLLFVLGFLTNSHGQIQTSFRLNGIWGKWEKDYSLAFSGSIVQGLIYDIDSEPYYYDFKWVIENYRSPTNKEINDCKKNGGGYFKYNGYVEYFVTEEYPTIESLIRLGSIYIWPNENKGYGYKPVKRKANAQIWVSADKKRPHYFQFFFDGIGIAVYFP